MSLHILTVVCIERLIVTESITLIVCMLSIQYSYLSKYSKDKKLKAK